MERRVRWKSHARCGAGENSEIISKSYLSLFEAAERLRDILHEHGYADIFRITPQLKDWNEQLKQLHGAEFLPAVPHERKELYLQSVAELNEMKINPNRIAADLIAAYNSADRIRLAEFSLAACEHFLKIVGVEFPLDQMKNRLANE